MSRRPAPQVAAVAAEPLTLGARQRRPLTLRRFGSAAVPYLLVVPVVVAIAAVLGYPLYRLVTLSFQRYGLPELIQRKGEWIGVDNYRSVLGDEVFESTNRVRLKHGCPALARDDELTVAAVRQSHYMAATGDFGHFGWHGSTFRLSDGAVVHGPATAPMPRFETQISDGVVAVMLPDAG